jgi:hypothetical protein
MRRIYVIVMFALVFCLCALAIHKGYPRLEQQRIQAYVPSAADGPTVLIDGTEWTRVVDWHFSQGPFPGGWSWGEWKLVDGLLQGTDRDGTSSVYFFPFTHGGNVILETKVRLVRPVTVGDVKAHLLTRDSERLNFESGMVLFGNSDEITIRHMAKMVDYIMESVPSYELARYDRWYIMRFMMRDGQIKAFLNGKLVYSSEWRSVAVPGETQSDRSTGALPFGVYREPHLTVLDGTADFEYVRVYIAH